MESIPWDRRWEVQEFPWWEEALLVAFIFVVVACGYICVGVDNFREKMKAFRLALSD